MTTRPTWKRFALRWLLWLLLAALALQVFFLLRIATMVLIDPVSTTFQRSEAWRLAQQDGELDALTTAWWRSSAPIRKGDVALAVAFHAARRGGSGGQEA